MRSTLLLLFLVSILVEPKLYLDANQNEILKYMQAPQDIFQHV